MPHFYLKFREKMVEKEYVGIKKKNRYGTLARKMK